MNYISENADGSEAQEGQQEPVDLNSRTQKFTICNRICGWTVKTWILTFLKTALYLRTTKIIKPSELKKGDSVRLIKKDDEQAGDAYIIFVE